VGFRGLKALYGKDYAISARRRFDNLERGIQCIAYHATEHSRLRMQYIWEEARFMTPQKRTNILWLRYERILGK